MAALSAVLRLVKSGEHVVAGDDLYGGTSRLLAKVTPAGHLEHNLLHDKYGTKSDRTDCLKCSNVGAHHAVPPSPTKREYVIGKHMQAFHVHEAMPCLTR